MHSRKLTARLLVATFAAAALPLIAAPSATAAEAATRPTEDIYTAPEATPVCRAGICVHYAQDGTNDVPTEDDGAGGAWKGYADNGIPDLVDLLSASILPKVAKVFTDAGYKPPVGDGTAGGGTDQVDIYLADLADVDRGAHCGVTSEFDETGPGWCVLDNDYSAAEYGTSRSPAANLGLDVAHQYFLLVQFAYSTNGGWLHEAAATWVEDEIYPSLNRNRAYLPYGPLALPAESVGNSLPHGDRAAWIFLRFLTERYPAEQGGLPVIMRDIWERADADGYPGVEYDEGTEAIAPVLADRGSSWVREMVAFSTWNLDPAHHYDEGAAYKPAPRQAQVTLSTSRRSHNLAGDPEERASRTVRFRRGSSLTGSWRLRLDLGAYNNFGATEKAFVATFKAQNRAPVTRILAEGQTISEAVTFAFGAGVEYVDIRIVTGRGYRGNFLDPVWPSYDIDAKVTR